MTALPPRKTLLVGKMGRPSEGLGWGILGWKKGSSVQCGTDIRWAVLMLVWSTSKVLYMWQSPLGSDGCTILVYSWLSRWVPEHSPEARGSEPRFVDQGLYQVLKDVPTRTIVPLGKGVVHEPSGTRVSSIHIPRGCTYPILPGTQASSIYTPQRYTYPIPSGTRVSSIPISQSCTSLPPGMSLPDLDQQVLLQ